MKFIQNNREVTALIAIVILFLLLTIVDFNYFHFDTVTMVFKSAQILILLAVGAVFVMLTRNIDVSVGSTMGLCAGTLGILLNSGWDSFSAVSITLFVGAIAGFFNGVLVSYFRIPAIVVTLGTLGLYRGIMLLLTGGRWIEGLPESIKTMSSPVLFNITILGYLIIVIVILGSYLLGMTRLGRNFYAVGDNILAARQLGVRTNLVRVLAFSINGFLAAIAGIVFASQVGFIPNQVGTGLEMKAIAACVLGGVSLAGGRGTLIGGVLGAFFLVQIDSVLVLLRLPGWWNDFIAGLVLLAVLVFDGRLRAIVEKSIRQQKYSRFIAKGQDSGRSL